MEQPPLIDVEPENGGKSRAMGCAGCLGKMIPLAAGLLLLGIILMAVALFIWGGDLERKGEDGVGEGGVAGTESVEEEKTGFAGVMEKVKRAVKGEKAPAEVAGEGEQNGTVSGEGAAAGGAMEKSMALAESIGAEGKSPAERNRLMEEKFGHLEKDGPDGGSGEGVNLGEIAGGGSSAGGGGGGDGLEGAREALAGGASGELPAFEEGAAGAAGAGQAGNGAQEVRKRRGGSFGSSTGAATSTGASKQYQRWRGDFSTSGSDLEFEVIYQESGGQLQFRCFVMPYDSQTARLFRADKGDFLLSFRDANGQRLVPGNGDLTIDLTKLTAFESQGKVMGWVARGMIPLNGQELPNLRSVKLGWDFDKELGDWLKDLKKTRGQ